MIRLIFPLLVALATLAACAEPPPPPRLGPDGKPLPRVYRIGPADKSRVTYNMVDGVNAIREAAGLQPLKLDAVLTAAAATHSRDMSIQNRPWHFGSDGSSPLDRVRRVGYDGEFIGELISETYEDEGTTLAAWAEDPITRRVLLDPRADEVGFAWFQEPNGKLWWTLVLGRSRQEAVPAG